MASSASRRKRGARLVDMRCTRVEQRVKFSRARAVADPVTNGRWIRLRYAGACRACDRSLAKGAGALYDSAARAVTCETCAAPADGATPAIAAGHGRDDFGRLLEGFSMPARAQA